MARISALTAPNEAGRHFFATERVNAGVDVSAVKSWLGHSDIATTQRYAKLRLQTLARVISIDRLGQRVDRSLATPPGFEPDGE
jgi:site-specific recombinase XerD